ncbi:hypothetical protein ACFQE0_18520 [Methylobacterium komagatae]|uniref:Uncharacterized protein n=1 Tax=Methylobacterium komagatae TaxID=374425 RepID=A0ABW2BNL6_9HYPH
MLRAIRTREYLTPFDRAGLVGHRGSDQAIVMKGQLPTLFRLAAALSLIVSASAQAEGTLPTRVGSCAQSTITSIGTRFSATLMRPKAGDFGEGTSVELKNGVYGISYDYVEAIGNSRIGDGVKTCLVSIPKGCPKGDDRGRFYKTTNLRTGESWTLPDSQHMCGGA